MSTNIDLSFMRDHNAVVHCKTREEANELIDAIIKMFPDHRGRDYSWRSCWNVHEEKTCYRFDLFEDGKIDFGYCHKRYYQQNRRRVIEYLELTGIFDYGEIETGFEGSADALSALF